VIKALQWSKDDISPWEKAKNVEAILIDGSTGGLGTTIPIDALEEEIRTITKPIIVAGGLTPENVGSVITTLRPAAVDVSSGVEIRRGVKDPTLICEFVEAALRATT
jgi:phosphoribosylanthranilate isomerase